MSTQIQDFSDAEIDAISRFFDARVELDEIEAEEIAEVKLESEALDAEIEALKKDIARLELEEHKYLDAEIAALKKDIARLEI